VSPLDKIMAASRPDVETGCRVWYGKRDSNGESKVRIRGNLASVKRYLTASKRKLNREGFYPVFENACRNQRCINVGHLVIVDWKPLPSNQNRGNQ
jgi:hypothetical protein